MNCDETMKCKVRRVLIYRVPSKDRYPEKIAHHLLFMFYPFRKEDELLTGNPPTYQNTLAYPSVLNALNKIDRNLSHMLTLLKKLLLISITICNQIKILMAI